MLGSKKKSTTHLPLQETLDNKLQEEPKGTKIQLQTREQNFEHCSTLLETKTKQRSESLLRTIEIVDHKGVSCINLQNIYPILQARKLLPLTKYTSMHACTAFTEAPALQHASPQYRPSLLYCFP